MLWNKAMNKTWRSWRKKISSEDSLIHKTQAIEFIVSNTSLSAFEYNPTMAI